MAVSSKSKATVHLYASYGYRDPASAAWHVLVQGRVVSAGENAIKRRAFIGLLRRALKLDAEAVACERFRARARPFVVNSVTGHPVEVVCRDQVLAVGSSGADGHFEGLVAVTGAPHAGWLNVALPGGSGGTAVHLIEPQGLSVISDIDDTIKVTDVGRRSAVLERTFLRAFDAVEGMPAVYARWALTGATFHYLSASPWQLYDPLHGWLQHAGLPLGSFHLRRFRWTDSSIWATKAPPKDFKVALLDQLLGAFPGRRFVLVGDAGETDPDAYAAIAVARPEQIGRIYIRRLGASGRTDADVEAALAAVPADRWQLFGDASELPHHPLGGSHS